LKSGQRIAQVARPDLLGLNRENDGRVAESTGERPFARVETINR
jgi:hypothetical protein